ncbi:hypothetical protein N7508_006744 [Penicillium antarcticum]|uniref:uncharacterized protein n=1 Tax=Penicillium antarcticum TaxID=416450 RepID=UPI002387FF5F|nr:uncharacterized protein N7508_006744 [Penicillium antarcticum]KAJ5301881.1 hypothetical protein N7508_006744 [Penicillium antarcticum]
MSEFTEANRKHFDKVASNHQNDFGDLINSTITELNTRRKWISSKLADSDPADDVRLLDYACGAGTVSKALASYTSCTIGLDLSKNMVAEYNKAAEAGLGPDRMQGYQYDILSPDTTSPPGGSLVPFDVVVTSMALHHVADPDQLLQAFSELLKPGGVCVVVDMVPGSAFHEGNEEKFDSDISEALQPEQREVFNTIGKHGFDEGETRALYEGAGIGTGFEYVVFDKPFRFTMFGERFGTTGFIARDVKA